ncbi:hypothetical protein [Lacipirellula limnantheis]|uniref:DUF4145 domain-containing protein n=1 Tax=Lacipirellula limnantheis TaxID=2528024 RepID=A0A517U1C8_9BACT|nr:hypothetical protein [Lacipirellula limnantheis]QDT74424.1 hypothetical protein I41_36200 [Lacipirellula limnantheis]
MVMLAVRELHHRPVECNARALLFKSQTALESNRLIEAGCHLREAVRVFLAAECEYWGVKFAKKKCRRTPGEMAHALRKAGQLEKFGFDWLEEIVGYANTLAHCGFVRPSLIATSLEIMHMFCDGSPYLVQPKAGGRV